MCKHHGEKALCHVVMGRQRKELAFHIIKEELSKITTKQAALSKSNLSVAWS